MELPGLSPADVRDIRGSISANTARAYAGHVRRLDAYAAGAPISDALLRDFIHALESEGKSPATISQAVAAAAFRAGTNRQPSPAGELTQRALKRIRREHRTRGVGQAAALTADQFAMIVAVAQNPRPRGRGTESPELARRRGLEDIAICGLLFHGGLRRSEIAALKWQDVQPAEDCPGALLVRVRGSKTDQTAARADVRLVKDRYAAALESIRPRHSDPALPVFDGLSAQSIARRFTQAAKAAGIEGRITAHCGRVSLASELTRRGASAIDTMLAGGWTTSRMVAHYASGATASRGAVARFL